MLLEGVVIVASILLAFGIEAWWGASQEREDVRAHLEALSDELQSQRAVLVSGMTRRDERTEVIHRLLEAIAQPSTAPPADTLNTWLGELWGAWDPLPPIAAIDNLRASGTFAAIESHELRLALSRLARGIDGAARHDERVIHAWENGLRPYLVAHSDALPQLAAVGRGLGLESLRPGFRANPETLLADSVFQNHLLVRLNRTRSARGAANGVLSQLDLVARLIDEELH